jgi:hypothetical protein
VDQTDGYRMVTAFVRHRPASQPQAGAARDAGAEADPTPPPLERRKRPGFFRLERPLPLWQLDMTSLWSPNTAGRAGLEPATLGLKVRADNMQLPATS